MRQIVLDTETTGMPVSEGHRIIEIGCVELVNRRLTGRHFHAYLQPDRAIDQEALAVHGISDDFLRDKPRFAEIAHGFYEFIQGTELIIHNAAFDLGFLQNEFTLADFSEQSQIKSYCTVIDTLSMARERHPGQRNNLDALCKRYAVDNSERTVHGALLDAELLAEVYLAMTGGQTQLSWMSDNTNCRLEGRQDDAPIVRTLATERTPIVVISADAAECAAHAQQLEQISKTHRAPALWTVLEANERS